jgi:RnfABCDGE-type electron transport complex B subunit
VVVLPVIIVGSVGLFFGIFLGIASKRLYVHIDPRVEKIQDVLLGANCGGCAYPGCGAFAQAVVEGKADPTGCIPGGQTIASKIAEILGVDAEIAEAKMAKDGCRSL